MPRRRPAALLAALALAIPASLALGGCGKSDDEQVRDTLDRFEKSIAKRDFATLCDDVFSTDLVKRVQSTGLSCEVALQRSIFSSTLQPSIDVEKVRVRGDTALAAIQTTAVGQPPSQDTIRLVKEKDDWRVSSLSGTQPPTPPRNLEGKPETQGSG
jgi:ketosteroid isomerase-like protein